MVRDAILNANQAIEDNADYRSTGSITKAILFVEAADTLLVFRPVSGSKGGTTNEEFRFDASALKFARDKAQKFIDKERVSAASSKTYLDFGCFRD